MNVPSFSVHPKQGREGFYAFFKKPWDGLQTSVKILDPDNNPVHDQLSGERWAAQSILNYMSKNLPPSPNQDKRHEIANYLPLFIKDEKNNLSKSTREQYHNSVTKFAKAMEQVHKVTTIEDIKWEMLRDYFDGLKGSYKPKGLFNYLTLLGAFYDYMIRIGAKPLGPDNKVTNLAKKYKKPSASEFGRNDVTWDPQEFLVFLGRCTPRDAKLMTIIYHTGLNPVDYFFMKKKDIQAFGDDFLIIKLRAKTKSPKAIIRFPLKYCKAKPLIMEAYMNASLPNDRLFETEYADEEYKRWLYTTEQRLERLWYRIWPEKVHKGMQALRHTFATEMTNGKRLGYVVPESELEKWMGWVPGSNMGRRYYIASSANPDLMRPLEGHQTAISFSGSNSLVNLQDRVPFT